MGDAVRRVQKHLQELSRDHLTSVEDRHHANLGWLQIELQQLCKQIEVEVRVELTRPPRLSFSKANALLPVVKQPASKNDSSSSSTTASTKAKDSANSTGKTTSAGSSGKPGVLPSPVHVPATRLLVFDAIEEETSPRASKKRRLDDTKKTKPAEAVDSKKTAAITREVIDVDADSDVEVLAVVPPPSKRMVKRTVKRTRKVLKPKKIIKTERKLIKEQKPRLPQVDVDVLKVVDLKSELKKRGLKQTGVKALLVQRLQEALHAEDAAQYDEDEGTWVTEEVVEEVMEEVEEEYEEEIEEEAVDQVTAAIAGPETIHPEQDVAVTKGPERISATVEDTAGDVAERETERLSAEDVNAPSDIDEVRVTEVKSTTAPLSQPSPTQSLSDMVAPMAVDEIVRESADGFVSPEGKMPPAQSASARKSPGKMQPVMVASRLTTIVEATPKTLETPVPLLAKAASASQSTANAGENAVSRPKSEPSIAIGVAASAKKGEVEQLSKSAPQSSSRAETVQTTQLRDNKTVVVAIPTLSATEKASVHPTSSVTKTPVDTSLQDSQQVPAVVKEFMTPSRDLMERVKSLASSSRSSSSSSLTAARRYTGSISYVEDSQPSPLQPAFTTDFSTHSARAASISQVEIQAHASKAKTPDSGSSVPPPSERIAQSEPRLNVAKLEVEDEATRKRREQQENIQREAQRLRLAMKQSAKKRFEESKTTTLFWKRDNAKEEDHVEVTASTQTRQTEPISNSVPSPNSSVDQVSLKSNQSVSRQESTTTEKVISETVAEDKRQEPLRKTAATTTRPAEAERSKASTTRSQPSASTSMAKKEPEKRVVPTRKRSSIVLDTSTSTLYPSKKRTSLLRSKDPEPVVKRTSLTRTSSPAEIVRKRTSTERKDSEPVVKRTNLTRTSSPAETTRHRTSTERAPAHPAALKRKRSSVSDDKPVDVTTVGKRTSITSSQAGQPGTRAQATSNASIAQKTSKTTTRTGIPSSTATKRRDSASSTISSSSSVSTSEVRSKPTTSVLSGGAVRRPANLVSGLHSFTTLLEKDSANLSSSQGSNTSSSRQAPSVGALKLAEKSRLLEQKKNLEKAKRKEALAKRYEEQRKADEDKRKKYALMKEKAEREARSKREQEQAAEKKQRDLELAKKRQQRLQEIRSGIDKKKPHGADKDQSTASKTVAPVSRVAGATSSIAAQPGKNPLKAPQARSDNKEVTTYVMSENEESSESEDEKDTERNSKNIPKWAQRENLERTLRIQFGPNAVDPTPSIFPDFVDSCDLEAIFEPTDVRKKKRFQRRTSSGNWLGDRPTAREKAVYKKDMGFSR